MFYWKLPRMHNPLLRILAMAAGLVIMAALLTLGLAVIAVLAVGAVVMLAVNAFRSRPVAGTARPAAAKAGVIEGEFRVVHEPTRKS